MKYVVPQSGLDLYTCPYCGTLARQYHWANSGNLDNGCYPVFENNPVRVSTCENCREICLWYFDQMVYPNLANAPAPNPDMPEDVRNDYEEAASIHMPSPRAAAALLRSAIWKLCIHLGGDGKDIGSYIKELVPEQVQESLAAAKVTGNDAVCPGLIDTDDAEGAGKLFVLLNVITEHMVSMPEKTNNAYSGSPDEAKEHICNSTGK